MQPKIETSCRTLVRSVLEHEVFTFSRFIADNHSSSCDSGKICLEERNLPAVIKTGKAKVIGGVTMRNNTYLRCFGQDHGHLRAKRMGNRTPKVLHPPATRHALRHLCPNCLWLCLTCVRQCLADIPSLVAWEKKLAVLDAHDC